VEYMSSEKAHGEGKPDDDLDKAVGSDGLHSSSLLIACQRTITVERK